MPPIQWVRRTISDASSSISATTSWMTVRTIRFLSRASVGGADQTALRSAASAATCTGDRDGSDVEASCAAILVSISPTRERAVPSQLQFRRDQPVLRIDGVVLPECSIGAVARRLEVAHQRVTNLIAAAGRLCFGLDGCSHRSRFDNPQKSFLDGVVDTQSSECDAAGLAIVERTPPTRIARNVMLGARVANRQLASTTPAADKAGEQSVAVLWRSVMSACGQVVAHHLADRLRPLPADVTLMDAWDQRQPFGSRLTTAPGSDHACGCIISCRDTTLTIGVGAAVDRVLDHPVDGRIVRPAPDHVAIIALGGQVQPMLDEPEQGFLDTAIGILLEPVADLHEADRGSDDEFATPGLLIAGRQGTVAQKIELILVEAALQ